MYFSSVKVCYLSSSKADVSKFATLSWHYQWELKIVKNDPM